MGHPSRFGRVRKTVRTRLILLCHLDRVPQRTVEVWLNRGRCNSVPFRAEEIRWEVRRK